MKKAEEESRESRVIANVEYKVLAREGERACGDAVVVRRESELTMLAVIDALGHGEKAQEVAVQAIAWLDRVALSQGVETIMTGLHQELRQSRGACALVCILGPGYVEGCSVGNVELRSMKARYPFALTPGVLGHRLHKPRVFHTNIARGEKDRMLLFSDGISGRFDLRATQALSTADACHAIFEQQRRSHDDATLLVADIES